MFPGFITAGSDLNLSSFWLYCAKFIVIVKTLNLLSVNFMFHFLFDRFGYFIVDYTFKITKGA